MSWWHGITKTFPVTSDIWWTVVIALLALDILLAIVGESLWLLGVKNFTALTWFVRYSIPRPWLIALLVIFSGFMTFLVWHFGWGKGWKTGPNT